MVIFQVWKMFRRNLQSVQYGKFIIFVPRGRHHLLAQGHHGQFVNDIRRQQARVRVGFHPGAIGTGSADFRDGVSEAVEYTYDRDGNMTSDLNRKVSLTSYDRQNQPARMIHAGGRMSGNADAHPVTGNGEHVVGRNLEIGGGTNGMEIARPGSSLMTVRPLYSFRSYYSL